ncbi:MAG: hypothetical protein H3C43_07215 [Leptonema sp. (in: Bacteria)]|nr:hypothetical protein [Leptonema sp. (in: bacteria)]
MKRAIKAFLAKNHILIGLLLLCFALHSAISAQTQIQLSTLLKSIEDKKSGTIVEVELDDNTWEIKVCNSICEKIYIDGSTGKELFRKKIKSQKMPPANSIPLSTIVSNVERKGQFETITEIELEKDNWEIEYQIILRKGPRKIKININTLSGEESDL